MPSVKQPICFGSKTFKTQKAAEEYVRQLLKQIGFCASVKAVSESAYVDLLDVLNRHPNSTSKLENVVDLCIRHNIMNSSAYELNIVNSDGSMTDVSWRMCVTGKAKTSAQELLSALRYSIEPQIQHHRQNTNTIVCPLCQCDLTSSGTHVDHVVHFECVVDNFKQCNKLAIPDKFDDATDGSHRKCFRSIDNEFENTWKTYHHTHAVLRTICKTCNLTREKYKH